jgi:nicotinic acid mononucleotide adenylyltransferase
MAAALESWERPERVLELARMGVVPRPGTELEQVRAALERLVPDPVIELIAERGLYR